jgi:hypothetical protein
MTMTTTPAPSVTPSPEPIATRSSQEILATWGNPENLDSRHFKACPVCHQTTKHVSPPDEVCLKCHGGTHSGLAKQTRNYQPMNPHDYHYGDIQCSFCHKMHEPKESPCGLCHDDYKLTRMDIESEE